MLWVNPHTHQHYAKSFKNQTCPDIFLQAVQGPPHPSSSMMNPRSCQVSDHSTSPESSELSESSIEVIDGDKWQKDVLVLSTKTESVATNVKPWKEKLEDVMPAADIKDWNTLCKQIQLGLEMHSKKMALSQINKLMIIVNFTTLCIKGKSCTAASLEIAAQWNDAQDRVWFACKVRILARNYEIFEQLLIERCGSLRSEQSLLKDELIKKKILDYLQSLPTRHVTPKKLQTAVNSVILSNLRITPKKLIGVCTAHRWLIKLG